MNCTSSSKQGLIPLICANPMRFEAWIFILDKVKCRLSSRSKARFWCLGGKLYSNEVCFYHFFYL